MNCMQLPQLLCPCTHCNVEQRGTLCTPHRICCKVVNLQPLSVGQSFTPLFQLHPQLVVVMFFFIEADPSSHFSSDLQEPSLEFASGISANNKLHGEIYKTATMAGTTITWTAKLQATPASNSAVGLSPLKKCNESTILIPHLILVTSSVKDDPSATMWVSHSSMYFCTLLPISLSSFKNE